MSARVGASSGPHSCFRALDGSASSGVISPASPTPNALHTQLCPGLCCPRLSVPACPPSLPLPSPLHLDHLGAAECRFQGPVLPGSGVRAPLNPPGSGMSSGSPLSSCWPACIWPCRGYSAGCLGGRPAGWDRLLPVGWPSLNTLPFPEDSNTDRPDASAVHLHDFQRFLLHEQQVRGQQGPWGGAAPAVAHLLTTCCRETGVVSLLSAAMGA